MRIFFVAPGVALYYTYKLRGQKQHRGQPHRSTKCDELRIEIYGNIEIYDEFRMVGNMDPCCYDQYATLPGWLMTISHCPVMFVLNIRGLKFFPLL